MDSIDATEARSARRPDGLLSRKDVLRLGAAFVGGVAAYSLTSSSPVHASGSRTDGEADRRPVGPPRPVPGGFNTDLTGFVPTDPLVHAFAPAVGLDMSTITDFKGIVAGADVRGGAHGSDGHAYWFDADMRFMKGTYIDLQGRHREHAFGFV